jgi:type IV secretory pathway VirB10-like protein
MLRQFVANIEPGRFNLHIKLARLAASSTKTAIEKSTTAKSACSAILQALRLGAASSLNQAGQKMARRNLNIQPTLTVKAGSPVRVIVNGDLVLEPYRG